MFRSLNLGRVFGIPVYLHWSFFLLPLWALMMSWSAGLATVLFTQAVLWSIFGCVLLHELGHALMARVFRIPTQDITLYPIGGVARLASTGDQPGKEIAIALAGPAVNLFLVVLLTPVIALFLMQGMVIDPRQFFTSASVETFLGPYLATLWMGNAILLCFNLIPAFPMDGGRVLRALLSLSMGRLRATEVASAIGFVLAVVFGMYGLASGQWSLIFISLFVVLAGQAELASLRYQLYRKRLEEQMMMIVPPLPQDPVGAAERSSTMPPTGGFTGMAWDPQRGVWVRWINGRPSTLV